MGHLDGSEQRLPQQQNLAPRTDPNAPFPSSRGMGHRHALSFGTFNNRHTPAQPPQNSDNSSVGSANAPSIARRHSSSSGYSSRSYSTSLYPNSSSSGHGAGNQASPAGSMYANSVSGRSSLSIARSVSQYLPPLFKVAISITPLMTTTVVPSASTEPKAHPLGTRTFKEVASLRVEHGGWIQGMPNRYRCAGWPPRVNFRQGVALTRIFLY
jgi:hypothetical protein